MVYIVCGCIPLASTNRSYTSVMKHLTHPVTNSHFLDKLTDEDLGFLDSVASVDTIGGGHYLFKKGEDANRFYLLRKGTLLVQTITKDGKSYSIMTLNPGELAGWSWLFPPYAWNFDGLALNDCDLIGFDAKLVREKCEEDNGFGYRIMKSLMNSMHDRLTATRHRLLSPDDD